MTMSSNTDFGRETSEPLTAFLESIEKHGVGSLSDNQLLEFGRLYRRASSALSRARTHGLEGPETARLNRLVGRAYAHLYVGEPRRRGSVRAFFGREFSRTFRTHLAFFLAAVGLFSLGAFVGGALTAFNPQMPDLLFGPGWADELENLASRHVGARNWFPEEVRPLMSSFIMVNNVQVAFLAFATGILFGLGTVYVLVTNGLLLGTVAVVVHRHGVAASFWGFVAPHGVIELTAIFIAGSAGLILGYALVRPGKYGRLDALKVAAREAIKLILGVVAMLIVAALIEAFVSPLPDLPAVLKLEFAATLGLAEYSYLLLTGRGDEERKSRRSGY